MSARLLQPSLTAGEMGPALYARVDTARYATGLRRCRNFIVRPTGGVDNRDGLRYLGAAFNEATRFRLLPFVFASDANADVAYVIELSHYYARFLASDALVQVQLSDTAAYAAGTTYAVHAYANSGGVIYRSLQAANTGNTPASSPLWWVADPTLVVATPWSYTQALQVRFTQSNDVMYLANQEVPPQTLRRLSPSMFQIVQHQAQEGPFRDLNTDEARVVVASAATGTVTLTANADIFSANSVGSLFYLETKNLGQLRPWLVGDRSVTVGALRRSDGKTYIAVTVPTGGTSWKETGNRQPIHEAGRAWDGAGDTRTDGTSTWSVGIEWEYVDSGYGIVLITAFLTPQTVTAEVRKRLPGQVVGSVPSAADTWNRTGDGVATVFSLTAPVATDGTYSVTISGVPVQGNPYYEPPPPIGGGGGGGGSEFDYIIP